jgi:hypothetical protein
MAEKQYASIWVRYLGGYNIHCDEVFEVPTFVEPKVQKLIKRGDVAEVWYMYGTKFERSRAYQHYPEQP